MKTLKTYNQLFENKGLDFSNQDLTSLPELSDSLEKLYCNDNKLTSLPELPDSLKELYCHNNELTSLPELPDSLEYLDCDGNKLTSLPELPDSLKELYCSYNDLPFNNLDEYKVWRAKDPHLTLKEKYKKWKRTLKRKQFKI